MAIQVIPNEEEDARDPLVIADRMVKGNNVAYKIIVDLDRLPDFHGIWGRLTDSKQSEILKSIAKIIDKNF